MGSSQSSHYSAKDLTIPEDESEDTKPTHGTTGRKLTLTFAYGSRKGLMPTAAAEAAAAAGKGSHFLLFRPKNLKKENQDAVLCRPCLGANPSIHLFGVFDGHGNEGNLCSQYVRDHMEELLSRTLAEKAVRSSSSSSSPSSSWQEACLQGRISPDEISDALKQSFLRANQALGNSAKIDDSFSGTTVLVALFVGTCLFIASSGDSRAVLGACHCHEEEEEENGAHATTTTTKKQKKEKEVEVLTIDHNPYRADECARIHAAGGMVYNHRQLLELRRLQQHKSEGVPVTPTTAINMDFTAPDILTEIDTSDDPPRVWDTTLRKPGCAFSRSLGDSYAKTLGVASEPEVVWRDLSSEKKTKQMVLCLASDGVFEYLSSQALMTFVLDTTIDAAAGAGAPSSPLVACCKAVCARDVENTCSGAHEERTEAKAKAAIYRDDTSLICISINVK